MIARITYLDANATEPLRPAARSAILAALDLTGNPSSVHAAGNAARRIVEDARQRLAGLWGAMAGDVVFTSGGTEANLLAIRALGAGRRIIIGAAEHDAVRKAPVADADILPVLPNGLPDGDALHAMLAASADPALVCVMLANNETGVIAPIADLAAVCARFGALLHVDAVQAAGRMPFRLPLLGAASIAVSAHKLGGPVGIGALMMAPATPFGTPIMTGGGQEKGRRGGTLPTALIAGFAAAAEDAVAGLADMARIAALRDEAEQAAIAAGAEVFGTTDARLANTTCLRMPGVKGQELVIALDLENIAVSSGAACSSGKPGTSHVLEAMAIPPAARNEAIRVSLPWNTTAADVARFAAVYPIVTARLRGAAPMPAAFAVASP